MRLLGLIAFAAAAAAEAFALSTVVGNPPPDIAGLFATSAGLLALAVHTFSAILFAFGGVLLTRRPRRGGESGGAGGMFAFLLVFALTLPVIGVAAGIVMVVLLNLRVRTDPFAEHFATGNPLLDRSSNPGIPEVPASAPVPLTTTLRELDREQLPRLILGLKHFLPASGARALLRRCQRDPSSQVQFYAQSALGDETGSLEDHLAVLGTRAETTPEDSCNRACLAEILLHLASMPGAGAGDREAQSRQALAHLLSLPETPTSLLGQARARVLLGDLPAARDSLEKAASLGAAPPLVDDLRREILFLEGDWPGLAADPARPLSPAHRAAMKFWRTRAA